MDSSPWCESCGFDLVFDEECCCGADSIAEHTFTEQIWSLFRTTRKLPILLDGNPVAPDEQRVDFRRLTCGHELENVAPTQWRYTVYTYDTEPEKKIEVHFTAQRVQTIRMCDDNVLLLPDDKRWRQAMRAVVALVTEAHDCHILH
jgi:hypothetical protein